MLLLLGLPMIGCQKASFIAPGRNGPMIQTPYRHPRFLPLNQNGRRQPTIPTPDSLDSPWSPWMTPASSATVMVPPMSEGLHWYDYRNDAYRAVVVGYEAPIYETTWHYTYNRQSTTNGYSSNAYYDQTYRVQRQHTVR